MLAILIRVQTVSILSTIFCWQIQTYYILKDEITYFQSWYILKHGAAISRKHFRKYLYKPSVSTKSIVHPTFTLLRWGMTINLDANSSPVSYKTTCIPWHTVRISCLKDCFRTYFILQELCCPGTSRIWYFLHSVCQHPLYNSTLLFVL